MSGGLGVITTDSVLGNSLTSMASPPIAGAYSEFEGVYGGCDEKYGMGGFVAVLLLVTALLLLYYVVAFVSDIPSLREGICGGKDEGCLCDGNETLTGGKYPSEIDEDYLSRVTAGQ